MPAGLALATSGLAMLAATVSVSAHAAEYAAETWISARGDYSSNLRYFRSGDDPVTSLGVTPGFRLSDLTETDGLLLTGSLAGIHNDTIEPRNRFDAQAGLTWRHAGERSAIDVQSTWTRDATLSVRSADVALNGQPSQLVQTGQVFAWAERNQFTLSPTITRALDERTSLGLAADVQLVRFRDAPVGLVDFDNLSIGPQWTHRIDQRDRLTLSMNESWYRPRVLGNHSESTTVLAGLAREATERLNVSASLGLSRTATHVEASYACRIVVPDALGQPVLIGATNADCAQLGVPLTQVADAGDSHRVTPRYSVSAEWRITERDRLAASVNRQVLPSPGGSTLDARYLQAVWTRDLSATLVSSTSLSQTVSTYTAVGGTRFEFRTVSTSLRWQFDRLWSLETGLGWSQALSGTDSVAPHSTSVFVQLRHDFDRRAVSR